MIQLGRHQFDRVGALFDGELPNRPLLESVLADRNPGWVFADREERPTAAVVVSHYSWTYVGGVPDRGLLEFAVARSAPAGDHRVIRLPEKDTVPGCSIEGARAIERIEFTHLEPTWKEPVSLPEGIALEPMTLALLEQCLWKDDVLADSGSLERFLDIGFGVCGVMKGRVVSEAYASIPGDHAYEIGIIVDPAFRRRGLAYLTCAALIDECRRRGYDTVWSCNRENVASAGVARALGYRRERPYRFWLPGRRT